MQQSDLISFYLIDHVKCVYNCPYLIPSFFFLLHFQHQLSDNFRVTLKRLTLKSSGLYRCEVSGEAPNFPSAEGEGRMEVVCKYFRLVIRWLSIDWIFFYKIQNIFQLNSFSLLAIFRSTKRRSKHKWWTKTISNRWYVKRKLHIWQITSIFRYWMVYKWWTGKYSQEFRVSFIKIKAFGFSFISFRCWRVYQLLSQMLYINTVWYKQF